MDLSFLSSKSHEFNIYLVNPEGKVNQIVKLLSFYQILLVWKKKKKRIVCVCSVMSKSLQHDCSSPGSTVYGTFQIRILEWVTISYSRGLPDPGIESAHLIPKCSNKGRQRWVSTVCYEMRASKMMNLLLITFKQSMFFCFVFWQII